MNPRLALRPDLDECQLEDRVLLYAPGLYPSGFLPSLTNNASLLQSSGGGGSGSGGSVVYPGPTFYYLLIGGGAGGGGISNGTGSAGISVYGLSANSSNGFVAVTGGAGGAGSSSGGAGGGASTASVAPLSVNGYSSSVSSGYGTSLNSTNSYGVSANAVGSVPVHTFDSGGTTQPDTTGTTPSTSAPAQTDLNTELWNSLLKRNTRPGQTGTTGQSGRTP